MYRPRPTPSAGVHNWRFLFFPKAARGCTAGCRVPEAVGPGAQESGPRQKSCQAGLNQEGTRPPGDGAEGTGHTGPWQPPVTVAVVVVPSLAGPIRWQADPG